MKKIPTRYTIIGISSIILCIISIAIVTILIWPNLNIFNSNSSSSYKIKKNSAEIEKRVSIGQKNIYVSNFVTEEGNTRNAHIIYRPSIILNIQPGIVKSLKILEFRMTTAKGEGLFIAPPATSQETTCFNYLGGICDDKVTTSSIQSSLVNGEYSCKMTSSVKTIADCLNQSTISPQFYIVNKNLGTFNYDTIFKKEGYFSSELYLKYANLEDAELNSEFSFIIQLEFDDGQVWNKRFSAQSDGNKIMSEMFYTINFEVKDI